MKGQLNIEFLAAAGLFILTLLTLVTSGQVLPDYSSNMDRMALNLELKTVTDRLLTEQGYHSYGTGGTAWEQNESTIENAEAVGLASEHHVIDRNKLNGLKTVTVDGSTALNYSSFRKLTGVENQYSFDFVWMPTVQTNKSYIKGDNPSIPGFTEPDQDSYRFADNRVHYGSVTLNGAQYNFLVTAHDGIYDTLYVRQGDWDFLSTTNNQPYRIGETIGVNDFAIESFQNRENDRGAMVILSKEIKEFGPSVNTDKEVVTLSRYAVLDGEPLKIEVAAW